MDPDTKRWVFSQELLASLRNTNRLIISPAQTPKSRKYSLADESDDSQSLIFFPKALLKGLSLSDNKEQKTSDNNLLDVPKQKKKSNCEFRSPSSGSDQSNWDSLFESQTEVNTDSHNASRTEDSLDWGVNESAPSSPMSPHSNQRSVFPSPKKERVYVSCRTKTALQVNQKTVFPSPKKDQVFVSCRTKTGMKWSCKNLSTQMGEVAEWLNEGVKPNCWLPISGNTLGKNNKSGDDLEKKTIAEVMCDLNPLNQGLVCFSGSINGKMGIKISVCDLDKLIAATTTCNCKQFNDEKS